MGILDLILSTAQNIMMMIMGISDEIANNKVLVLVENWNGCMVVKEACTESLF